jgi:RND family efflux transporter MFP subunit
MSRYLIARTLWPLLLAPALAGCGGERHVESTPPAIAVQVAALDAGVPGGLTLPARIKAAEEVTLTARMSGRVSAFPAAEGRSVAAGAVIVRFDAPDARRALEATRADEQAATVAAMHAARQRARVESLRTAGVVSASDAEAAEANDRGAAARLAQATAAREIAESAFEVRAPFAGVVVRRHVDRGADVQAGRPRVDLRSPSGAAVVAAVPEAAAAGLERARIEIQAGDGPWRPARLLRADGMVDPMTRTRTARFAPVEHVVLEPGAFARVRIAEDGVRAAGTPIAVPLAAVTRRGALTGVYVIEEGRAWLRWLRLGRTQGDRVEVLSGLDATDQVAATPERLHDGAHVRVTP